MNVITRGVRNAFRNVVRTVSLVVILGISMGLMLAMLVAYQAVGKKIESVKSTVGNTVSISPAGVRGFEGGGNALTGSDLSKVSSLAHVTTLTESLNDRLTTDNTNLQSAVDAGSLGRRFARNNGEGFAGAGGAGGFGGNSSDSSGDSTGATSTFTPPVTLIGTTSPTDLSSSAAQGGGTFTLKSGKVFDGTGSDNVALVGSTLATKNNLKVGSIFTAYSQTITVDGIFDAGNTFSDNMVIMPLKTVQTLSSQSDAVTSAIATVDSISNVSSVTTAVKSSLGSKADVTNASEQAQNTITPLENIRTISLYSLIGAIIAGAAIILLTMIMIVRERRREIGVLKAIGAGNGVVMGQFVVESVTLTVLGSVIGILLGAIAGNPITKMLVNTASSSASGGAAAGAGRVMGAGGRGGFGGGGFEGARRAVGGVGRGIGNIQAAVGWDIILYGLAAAIVIALIGSVLTSFFIAKIRPAEVMRVE